MDYVLYFIVIFVILMIIFIIYNFWSNFVSISNNLEREKFKTILTIISTIASLTFGSAVVFQVISFNNQKKIDQIDNYTKLSKEVLDEILQVFIYNPDMQYYYNDLIGIQKIGPYTKRNLIKEHQISMFIFSKFAKYAIYEQQATNKESREKVKAWMGHVLNTFLKSDVFRSYWINEYKPKLTGPAMNNYMEKYYNV